MKKIIPVRHDKIWGYEIWLSSPVKGKETLLEDGTKITFGPLIKIIKADQPLSVQVHPDDLFAKQLENQENGKSESWYIIDAKENANLVLGLKNYDEKAIRKMLEENTFEENLNHALIKKGEFYDIPAGLIHGIGAGSVIFEVQQPSDVTYRYYDYNRLENGVKRELHVDKAIKVQKELPYELKPISNAPLMYKNEVGTQTYLTSPSVLENECIVVDLDAFEAYLGQENETINLNNYCLVSI